MSGNHSSQMCGAAGGGDDYADATIGRVSSERGGCLRRAMRRKDVRFIGHAQLIERFDRLSHRFPIRFTTHDDGDQ